jgi:hypothetical protein
LVEGEFGIPVQRNQERSHAYDQDFRNTRNNAGDGVRGHIGICLSCGIRRVWGRLLPQAMSIVDRRP